MPYIVDRQIKKKDITTNAPFFDITTKTLIKNEIIYSVTQ